MAAKSGVGNSVGFSFGGKLKKKARIIAVTSGKGGVGKTNFSVNLGLALAKRGKKVVLADLDLGLANVDIVLNIRSKYTIEHVIKKSKRIDDILVSSYCGLKVIPGGSGLVSLLDLNENERRIFLESFYELSIESDYIIFDTAAGISENVVSFLMASDEVIVVTTEEPTAVTDAYALIKVLSKRKKDSDINFVVNMVADRRRANKTFAKLSGVIKKFLGVDVSYLGFIAYDHNVKESVLRGKPLITHYPLSMAAKTIREIAVRISAKNKEGGVFLNRFFEIFS